MTLKRKIIRLLDRSIGRNLLTVLTNQYVKSVLHMNAGVRWEGVWIHRVGSQFFVDGTEYDYYVPIMRKWPARAKEVLDEHRDFWLHLYRPRPGDVILNLGAGIGIDSMVFSEAVGPEGRVFAIEAHPTTYSRLLQTIRLNNLTNVIPVHKAIMDRSGRVFIEDGANDEANAVSTVAGENQLPTEVDAVSLDQFCRDYNIDRVDFIKMNIEGAERFVIEGMSEIVGRTRAVTIACHDFRSESGDEFCTNDCVLDFLTRNGFQIQTRDADSRSYVRDHIHGIRGNIEDDRKDDTSR